MAKPAKPAAAKKEDVDVAAAPKSKKKLIIMAVLVLAIAGGAGWFFMKGKSAEHAEAAKVEEHKDPLFIPLDAFTVNLQREEADQFLQVSITLKVFEPELVEKIKAVLPEIRSKLNLLLSSKRPSELAMVEGKAKLAAEIGIAANNVLGIHNTPESHTPAPASAPVAASEVAAVSAPVAGEAASAPEAAAAEGEAASAPVAVGSTPVHTVPAAHEKKGVVDVLFTSFIIQ